eukprot:1409891-Rhodomonas_salina.1
MVLNGANGALGKWGFGTTRNHLGFLGTIWGLWDDWKWGFGIPPPLKWGFGRNGALDRNGFGSCRSTLLSLVTQHEESLIRGSGGT